ncbi:MAG: hypothetical protein K2K80_08460 [Clostridia bacterium]|nr:hypothetical protein [Clostridia bacterium]
MKDNKKSVTKNDKENMTGEECIMTGEPLPNVTTEDWMAINHYCETEYDLANAYAGASNMVGWLDDELYDDDVTQEEIKRYEEWKWLYTQLEEKIMSVLKKENTNTDFTGIGLQKLFTLFMSRNGFFDENGWWIKKR